MNKNSVYVAFKREILLSILKYTQIWSDEQTAWPEEELELLYHIDGRFFWIMFYYSRVCCHRNNVIAWMLTDNDNELLSFLQITLSSLIKHRMRERSLNETWTNELIRLFFHQVKRGSYEKWVKSLRSKSYIYSFVRTEQKNIFLTSLMKTL
jgi:hypothetical protein